MEKKKMMFSFYTTALFTEVFNTDLVVLLKILNKNPARQHNSISHLITRGSRISRFALLTLFMWIIRYKLILTSFLRYYICNDLPKFSQPWWTEKINMFYFTEYKMRNWNYGPHKNIINSLNYKQSNLFTLRGKSSVI